MSTSLFSLAFGVGTQNRQGTWLEVFYALPLLDPSAEIVAAVAPILGYTGGNQAISFNTDLASKLAEALKSVDASQAALLTRLAESHKPLVATLLAEDAALTSTPEAYLKLHLLSHRLVKPHGLSLAGVFPLLPNVAWTSQGAIDLAELAQRQLEARLKGELLEVFSVDKFPKMTDYVVPAGVRIADTARVRLGAYIGEGTTVMHEGFVNFNGGTEGPGMIEGRVSAGVFVGKGSDLGGGCSTMGTLSGGGNIVIKVGDWTVGLVVDTVSEVLDIPQEMIEPPPRVISSSGDHFIAGLGKVEDQVRLLLDANQLLGWSDDDGFDGGF